jgi:hypothetical protein
MKLKITRKGVFEDGKELPVGTIVEVEGNVIPVGLVNKCIDTNAAPEPEAPVEPVVPSASERQTLLKNVAIMLDAGQFKDDGAPKTAAVNAEVEADAKFSADEIAQLWAGISATVEAERTAKVQG